MKRKGLTAKPRKERVQAMVSVKLYEQLHFMADMQGISMSELVRTYLQRFVKEELE